MASVMQETISDNFLFNSDPDNQERIGSIYVPLSLVAMYLVFVKKIGPAAMKNKEPFKMNGLLILFNVVCILSNCVIFYGIISVFKELIHTDGFCTARAALNRNHYFQKFFPFVWIYFLMKRIELLDTVFFVLRKKDRQVSFLHVYHHAFMVCFVWNMLHTKTQSYGILFCFWLNAFIHIVTYTYYTLAAFGFNFPFKKYITFLQFGQFMAIQLVIVLNILFGCDELSLNSLFMFVFLTTLHILFIDFYRQSYKKD